MSCLHPIDLDVSSPNALFAARSARSFAARRAAGTLRGLLSPASVLCAALVAAGCSALLALTGVGAASWQGRMCRADDIRLRPCQASQASPGIIRSLRAGAAS